MLKLAHYARLDQGSSETYSCPTCRKPLFGGRLPNEANHHRTGEVLSDEQLAHQISAGLDHQNTSEHTLPTGVFPNQTQNPLEDGPWRFTLLQYVIIVSCAYLEISGPCYILVKKHGCHWNALR